MKWDYTNKPEKRTVSKFAIIPRLCQKGHKHWLETVKINQRFIGSSYSNVDFYGNFNPFGPSPCICNAKDDDNK